MSDILSREQFDDRKPPKNNQFDGRDAEILCATIEAFDDFLRVFNSKKFRYGIDDLDWVTVSLEDWKDILKALDPLDDAGWLR